MARMIEESPALLAREQQIFAGFTDSLAELLREEPGAKPTTSSPWVAANAMMGVHRALIALHPRRGHRRRPQPAPCSAASAPRRSGARALDEGLGGYAVKAPAGT